MLRGWLAALIVLAACGGSETAKPAPRPAPDAAGPKQRRLTDAEVALLRPIYRDSIDYTLVRVVDDKYIPFQPDTTYMTPENRIYAPGQLWQDDYAASTVDPYQQAVFVHELGHVWQYQNGTDLIAAGLAAYAGNGGDYAKAYPYTLAADRDLVDYGVEQQASIFEDRFLIRVHHWPPTRMENTPATDAERDALYDAVLARFDADPTYTRAIPPEEQFRRQVAALRGEPPGPPGCGLPADQQKSPHLCNWRFDDR